LSISENSYLARMIPTNPDIKIARKDYSSIQTQLPRPATIVYDESSPSFVIHIFLEGITKVTKHLAFSTTITMIAYIELYVKYKFTIEKPCVQMQQGVREGENRKVQGGHGRMSMTKGRVLSTVVLSRVLALSMKELCSACFESINSGEFILTTRTDCIYTYSMYF
jgi:hypothetical protein